MYKYDSKRESHYIELKCLKITPGAVLDILSILKEDKPFEKEICKTYLTCLSVDVIYSDCANRSIEDISACDAYYCSILDIIFIDIENAKSPKFYIYLAHEFIHFLQEKIYVYFDSDINIPEFDRWEEIQARKFEKA